jgi:hypothetical protein
VPAIGLKRIAISLDGTTAESVGRMAGAGGAEPGQGALKLNAVIQRGANNDQLLPLAAMVERGAEAGVGQRQGNSANPHRDDLPGRLNAGHLRAWAVTCISNYTEGLRNCPAELCLSVEDQAGARCRSGKILQKISH